MKKKLFTAVVATIVALCTVSCSESTSENSGENSKTALKKGVVFRTAVYGRLGASTDVLLEDGTIFYASRYGAKCSDEVRFLAHGDTVFYKIEKGESDPLGYVEDIHWKK